MSLQMKKVSVLWKTSCLILVPKLGRPVELNDYRPVALVFHIMKTLELLFVRRIKLQVVEDLDPLQFAKFICESHVLGLLQCLQHHSAFHTERQVSRYGCGPLPDIVDYRLFDCHTTICQDGEMCFWNAVLGLHSPVVTG